VEALCELQLVGPGLHGAKSLRTEQSEIIGKMDGHGSVTTDGAGQRGRED
jgi:hypothetical protein